MPLDMECLVAQMQTTEVRAKMDIRPMPPCSPEIQLMITEVPPITQV